MTPRVRGRTLVLPEVRKRARESSAESRRVLRRTLAGSASERSTQDRLECSLKLDPVTLPATRIRQLDQFTLPLRASDRASHIGCGGANNRDDDLWIQPPNGCAQPHFTPRASELAILRRHPVDRTSAQIDQVAIQIAKRFQEVRVLQFWECRHKSLPDRAIESGVRLIKEPPRRRRRLTHEQHPHTRRLISPSQAFPCFRKLRGARTALNVSLSTHPFVGTRSTFGSLKVGTPKYPPSHRVYWNHRVRGKSRESLCGLIFYG